MGPHAPVAQEDDVVGLVEPLARVVRDHDDREPVVDEAAHDGPELASRGGVETSRGLVEDVGVRPTREHTGKRHATHLTAGELEGGPLEQLLPHPRPGRRETRGALRRRLAEAARTGAVGDVLQHRLAEDLVLGALEREAHATRPNRLAVERDEAGVRLENARKRAGERRLARARPPQDERQAGRRHVGLRKGLDALVRDAQPACLQRVGAGALPGPRRQGDLRGPDVGEKLGDVEGGAKRVAAPGRAR